MNPKISVVIPYFNRKNTIVRAIDSVIRQTYKNIEIILVNDGSTDGGDKIVESFIENHPGVCIKHITQSNLGPSEARNNGVRVASSSIIAFLDSDDSWLPEKIEKQLDAMTNNDFDMLGCNILINNNDHIRRIYLTRKRIKSITLWNELIKNYLFLQCVLVKRDVLIECGGFPIGQNYAEDLYFFWIATSKYKVGVINYFGTMMYKEACGSSGLSANLKMGFFYQLLNIKKLNVKNIISPYSYIILYVFFAFKYLVRRIRCYTRQIMTRNSREKSL